MRRSRKPSIASLFGEALICGIGCAIISLTTLALLLMNSPTN